MASQLRDCYYRNQYRYPGERKVLDRARARPAVGETTPP